MQNEPHDVASSHVINLGVARVPGYTGNYQALELLSLAGWFIHDAEALGDQASPGQYVLAIHGIELALKCFLHDKGIPLEELGSRKYGHNLEKLLTRAYELGLVAPNPHTNGIISRLNQYTEKAKIRYDMRFQLPLISDVINVAKSLADANKTLVPGANVES